MSLMENKTKTILEKDNSQTNKRKSRRTTLNLVIVMMFLLQLILPVGLHVNAMGDTGETEEAVTAQMQEVEVEEAKNAEEEAAENAEEEAAEEARKAEEAEEARKTEEAEAAKKAEEAKKTQEAEEAKKSEENKQDESSPSKTEELEDDAEEEVVESEELEEENLEEVADEEEIDEIIDPEAEGYDGVELDAIAPLATLISYAKGSLGPEKPKSMMSRATFQTGELAPGEVRTDKKATRVPGMVNTWDIEVSIEGRDDEKIETTDVVLVIDRSGSMGTVVTNNPSRTRMYYAKEAAKNFVNTMIDRDENLRIAIVSFGSTATEEITFTNDKSQLISKINGLTANGATHTQAAILQGKNLINGSGANNRYMVLLSDGMPTYSYEPKNWKSTTIPYNNNNYNPGIYDGQYNATTVGTGNTVERYYTRGTHTNDSSGSPYRRYINNGDAAIKAGTDTKATGIDGLYTIAVSAGTVGAGILNQIASPGKSYSTEDSTGLAEIYDEIAGQISTQFALRNAVVIDEMGDGFTLINGSIVTTQGTSMVANASGGNNQTITWTIDPAVLTLKPGSTNIRQAKMTYRVEITPDIVSAPVATAGTTADHDLFKTNKLTKLNYLDSDNIAQERQITSPEVDPVLLKIKKILKDEAGNIVSQDPRLFNVQITNGGSGFNQTEDLIVGADYEILTTLRKEGTYNVEEISITGEGDTDLSHFNISYNIDGAEGTTFNVNHNGAIPRGDIVIEVTNEAITQDVDFTFTKVDSSGEPLEGAEFTLETEVDGQTIFIDNTGVDPVFTFAGLTEGVYTLTETKAPVGYKLPTTNWMIEVVRNETTGLLEIIIPDDSFLTSDPVGGNKVENQEQSEFPKTGGIGGLSYIAVGLTILTTSLGIFIKKEEQ